MSGVSFLPERLSDKVNKFNQEISKHLESQSLNPFSGQFSRSPSPRPVGKDEYGKEETRLQCDILAGTSLVGWGTSLFVGWGTVTGFSLLPTVYRIHLRQGLEPGGYIWKTSLPNIIASNVKLSKIK